MRFESHDSVVFLSMWWGGGGPFALSDLIHVYDWINRDILRANEMEGSLNRLLAANLITRAGEEFAIPSTIYEEFQQHRRRRRKDRFEDAESFLKGREFPQKVRNQIRLSEAKYKSACRDHSKAIREAFAEMDSRNKK